jgi:hypothetical protein
VTLEIPASTNPVVLADWAEAVILSEDLDLLSKSEIKRRTASTGSPEESDLSLMLGEIRRRGGIAGGGYPFRADQNVIERLRAVDALVYEALLLLSVRNTEFRKKKLWNTANLIMDRLARDAIREYVGSGSTALRFAWPVSDGRPKDFTEAIKWLANHLDLELGAGPKNPAKKDGGVDVVAWRRFRDPRSKYAIVLAQCTFQRDFKHKARDIFVDQWMSWILFGWDPSVALVVPFVIGVNDADWDDLHFSCSFVMDRTRILEFLDGVALPAAEVPLLQSWVDHERAALATP